MNMHWQPAHLEVVVVVVLFTLLYLIHHFQWLARPLLRLIDRGTPEEPPRHRHALVRRLSGMVLLGVIPMIVLPLAFDRSLSDFGFSVNLEVTPEQLLAVPLLMAVSYPLLRRFARSPEGAASFLDLHAGRWTREHFLIHLLGTIGYLVAYEFALRGYLLFTLAGSMGSWPAIAVMTAIYTAVHLPRGPGEAFACTASGFVLGYYALATGSILLPAVGHVYSNLVPEYLAWHRGRRESGPGCS